jgi:hypothetical protein
MVAVLIDETGHSGRSLPISRTPTRRTIMLKTLSAALLAISVIAAPAMAAGTAKTTAKSEQAPAINSVKAKPAVMNANARMGKHHHRFHKHSAKHISAKHVTRKHFAAKHRRVAHKFSKVSVKHITHAAKRG